MFFLSLSFSFGHPIREEGEREREREREREEKAIPRAVSGSAGKMGEEEGNGFFSPREKLPEKFGISISEKEEGGGGRGGRGGEMDGNGGERRENESEFLFSRGEMFSFSLPPPISRPRTRTPFTSPPPQLSLFSTKVHAQPERFRSTDGRACFVLLLLPPPLHLLNILPHNNARRFVSLSSPFFSRLPLKIISSA